MHRRRALALLAGGLAAPAVLPVGRLRADDPDGDWDAFAGPGVVALMRHALAPGGGDPPGFEIGDCATQRNLDDRGREQARRTGAAFRDRGLAFDRVMTSQWCRCRDTAELLDLGAPEDLPALNSFFGRYAQRDERTEGARDFIAARPAEARLFLVTHQVNISALVGRGTRSGEVVAARRLGDGRLERIGRVLIPA